MNQNLTDISVTVFELSHKATYLYGMLKSLDTAMFIHRCDAVEGKMASAVTVTTKKALLIEFYKLEAIFNDLKEQIDELR